MPEAPSVPSHVRTAVQSLHADWDVAWRPEMQRFAVVKNGWWKGRRQAIVLHVCQDEDGSFRNPDQRLVTYMSRQVYRDRNGWFEEREVSNREQQAEQQSANESQSNLESHRDELKTRLSIAKWTGRKRRHG